MQDDNAIKVQEPSPGVRRKKIAYRPKNLTARRRDPVSATQFPRRTDPAAASYVVSTPFKSALARILVVAVLAVGMLAVLPIMVEAEVGVLWQFLPYFLVIAYLGLYNPLSNLWPDEPRLWTDDVGLHQRFRPSLRWTDIVQIDQHWKTASRGGGQFVDRIYVMAKIGGRVRRFPIRFGFMNPMDYEGICEILRAEAMARGLVLPPLTAKG